MKPEMMRAIGAVAVAACCAATGLGVALAHASSGDAGQARFAPQTPANQPLVLSMNKSELIESVAKPTGDSKAGSDLPPPKKKENAKKAPPKKKDPEKK